MNKSPIIQNKHCPIDLITMEDTHTCMYFAFIIIIICNRGLAKQDEKYGK